MGDNKGWTADLVRQQLQNAVYLELWTIPFYLAAAYSIKAPVNPSTSRPEFAAPVNPDGSTNYNQYAFNLVLSVAIQEMLHVELAANILNAVCPTGTPTPAQPAVRCTGVWAPDCAKLPPSLDGTLPPPVKLQLGPMDLNQAQLFQWIESSDPTPPPDPQAYSAQYKTIGDFYTALEYGVQVCWNDFYPPPGLGPAPTEAQLCQKDDWGALVKAAPPHIRQFIMQTAPKKAANGSGGLAEDYPFSIPVYGSAQDALTYAEAAMMAIVAQGEGADPTHKTVPDTYRPTSGDPIEVALDAQTHYERFTEVVALVQQGKVEVYQITPPSTTSVLNDLQDALNQSYSSFLAALETIFASSDGTLGDALYAMRGIGNRALQVWQNGGLPQFQWQDPTPFIQHLHACQGLNMCQGMGVNNTGTKPGDGDCATAWYHTCGQANQCRGQGGCGFPVSASDLNPNFNLCKNLGGCGSPIPAEQIFTDGMSVWSYARQLLRDKLPGFPSDDPAPNELRSILSPTSQKPAAPTSNNPTATTGNIPPATTGSNPPEQP